MGDDIFPGRLPIATRINQLSQLIQGKSSNRFASQSLVTQDGLVDALLVLHDECKNESLRRNKHVRNFLDKSATVVGELGKLRIGVNDFDVKKTIGRGHFGEVQLVRERQTDDVYAMKTLRKSDTLAQQNVAFFEAERDILAKATSPWLTKLEYAFQDDKNLYLCMEFHAGGDLLALLARFDDVFEEDMARFYLAELTQAIRALHSMGYCHSDVKPENCLLDRTGHLKLADFGSSARITETCKTKFRMPVGSPDYLCPELLCALNEGGVRAYGAEVDWWSLGICAFEFLYGFTPFTDPEGLVATTYTNIMNHEQTLEFPEDITVSRSAVLFIRQLLTTSDKRLDYSGIFKHPFFTNTDFTRLRESKPPYIPNLTSSADTSNFDDFEPMNPAPHLDTNSSEFSGKNLPFIGFTYTKRIHSDRSSVASIDTPQTQNRLERKLTLTAKELHDVKGQIHSLKSEDSMAKRKLSSLEQLLRDKEEIILRVEKERDAHEKDIAEYVSQIASLKRCLDLEREARKESNRKAHEAIQEIKTSMKRAQQLQEGYRNDQLDQHKEFIADLEEQRLELSQKNRRLAKELNFSKEEVRELTDRLRLYEEEVNNVKEESRASLCELSVDIKRKNTEFTVMENTYKQRIHDLEKIKEKLANDLEELNFENANLQETIEKIQSTQCESAEILEKFSESEEKRKSLEIRLHELQQIEGVEQRLTEQLHAKGKRITELSQAVTDREEQIMKLENQVKKMERNRSRIRVDHEDQIRTLELRIQELDMGRVDVEKIEKLGAELEERNERVSELLESVAALQENLELAENRMKQLERSNREKEHDSMRFAFDQQSLEHELNESKMHKDRMKSKIEKLVKELEEARGRDSADRDKYLDLRIEMRQLKKDHESALTDLRSELNAKTSSLADAQSTVTSLEKRNGTLRMTVEEVRNALAESSHTYEQKILELERETLKLKSEIGSHERDVSRADELKTDLKIAREQCGSIKQQNKDLANELEKYKAQKTKLENEVKVVKSELDKTVRKDGDLEKKLHEFEQDCRMLKSDLKDRDARIRDYELKVTNWAKKKQANDKNAMEMESEIDDLSKSLVTESKQKQELSVTNKKLKEEVDTLRATVDECGSELDRLRIAEQRLTVDCEQHDKENSKFDMELKNALRRLNHQEQDNFRLKEETSQLITEIKTLKASNFTLSQNLENAMDKYDNLNAEKVELENQLETNCVNFEHDKFKLDSTIAQQSKLISFLQAKTETPCKKKKTILFGAKQKEATLPGPAPCARALQQSLDVERHRNEDLKSQITKLKSEIHQLKTHTLRGKGRSCAHCDKGLPTSPVSTAALSALALSPSNQSRTSLLSSKDRLKTVHTTPLQRPSRERMHHNIPHRFQTGINTRATKCAVCLGSINFVRQAAKCQECAVVCHPKCAQSLPASCGLPTQYMQHFAQVMTKKVNSPAKILSMADIRSLELSGWMKLPKAGKQAITGWEKKWVSLEDDNIAIYDKDENDTRPLDTFCLFPKGATVNVCSAVHASELNQTASTDLPYILKLESQPKNGTLPGRILYLMAMSFNEKQKWVASLEVLLSDDTAESKADVHGHTVISAELDMNCSLRLNDELLILGCEEGLYVLATETDSKPVKLEGLESVYQLQKLGQKIILIAGNQERELLWIESRTLLDRASQACRTGNGSVLAKSMQPQKIKSCTLFESAVVGGAECICAATTDRILVMKYNQGLQNFGVRKDITTTEPCSCMYMSDTGLLVGTDKVYTVSLDHYVMRELLDREDKSLAFAVFGASSYDSYPLAIHRIDDQYLLSFHEFGVFVDSSGRRARRYDLKWTGLPLSFLYYDPYLYVTYFNSVQVINVRSDNYCSRDQQTFVDLPSPRCLGTEPREGAVYLSSNRGAIFDLVSLRGNIPALRAEDKENALVQASAAKRRCNSRRLSFDRKRIITTSLATLNTQSDSSTDLGTDTSLDSPPKRKRPY